MERAGKLLADALLGQSQLRRKPPQLKCPSFQFGITAPEGILGLLACTDVGNEGNGVPAAWSRDVIQTDFNRKQRAILPLTNELTISPHESWNRFSEVIGSMPGMGVTAGLRDEPFDGLPGELSWRSGGLAGRSRVSTSPGAPRDGLPSSAELVEKWAQGTWPARS